MKSKLCICVAFFLFQHGLLNKSFAEGNSIPLFQLSNGSSSFWIIGSMHVGNKILKEIPELDNVIRMSKGVCFEHDPFDQKSIKETETSVYFNPANITLEHRIGQQAFERLKRQISGMFPATESFQTMSPFAAAGILESINPYGNDSFHTFNPTLSLDQYIKERALSLKIKIHGLESGNSVTHSFSKISNEDWTRYVNGYLNMLNCISCSSDYFSFLRKSYNLSADPEQTYSDLMNAMTMGPKIADVYEKIFFKERNPEMVHRIQHYAIDAKQCDLVVVGAAHLGGTNGVLRLLKKSGFEISMK